MSSPSLFSALLLRTILAPNFPTGEKLRLPPVRWIDACVEINRYNLPLRAFGFPDATFGEIPFCIESGNG